jgi:hypothetical protein
VVLILPDNGRGTSPKQLEGTVIDVNSSSPVLLTSTASPPNEAASSDGSQPHVPDEHLPKLDDGGSSEEGDSFRADFAGSAAFGSGEFTERDI